MADKKPNIKVIDLFCWIGGITRWFIDEDLNVVAGIDFEGSCKFGYEANNKWAQFIHKDIREVKTEEIEWLYGEDCDMKILVWCAPCQPFSGMNNNKWDYFYDSDKANSRSPLDKFAHLVETTLPTIVSMENVANLANKEKYPAFVHFLDVLEKNKYSVWCEVIDTSDFWIPQKRKRLVLLASRLWDIELIKPEIQKKTTVYDVLKDLPPIGIGETHPSDPYHRSQDMSPLNRERIKVIPKNGWTLARSGADHLMPACHKKASGKSYSCSVYGRMRWDEPSPTLTTLCLWLWNGRYWHPEQDRAISLREAAIIQTFPKDYQFTEDTKNYNLHKVAKYIGNAVPVKLGQIIAKSIKLHLANHQVTV